MTAARWQGFVNAVRISGLDLTAPSLPVLALAGSLAAQPVIPHSSGTLPTGGALFVWFLFGVIVIAGGLTYLPALALGPIVEHLRLVMGALN